MGTIRKISITATGTTVIEITGRISMAVIKTMEMLEIIAKILTTGTGTTTIVLGTTIVITTTGDKTSTGGEISTMTVETSPISTILPPGHITITTTHVRETS